MIMTKDGGIIATDAEMAVINDALARGPNAQGIYDLDDWFYGEMARVTAQLAAENQLN
jgi:hypothetical protein